MAWSRAGAFSVWDVHSGERLVTFRESNQPQAVMVNETKWRLTVEAEDAGSAGRYRRSVATVWDLTTGRRLEKTDATRGAGPATGTAAPWTGSVRRRSARTASCTRCRCAPRPAPAVALQASRSDQEVFRAEHPSSLRVRMAFTADGRFLLTNWDSDLRSQVDVWEL